jgi:hypothetical protein
VENRWQDWVEQWQPANRGQLAARAVQPPSAPDDPCNIPPDARYRGAENQLYRVEIHLGGTAADAPKATFKWSRENGSVIFPIRQIAGAKVTLEALGRDARLGLQAGDWVEIVDDDYTLQNQARPLLQVDAIDDDNVVTLAAPPDPSGGRHPDPVPAGRDVSHRRLLADTRAHGDGRCGVAWAGGRARRAWPTRRHALLCAALDYFCIGRCCYGGFCRQPAPPVQTALGSHVVVGDIVDQVVGEW